MIEDISITRRRLLKVGGAAAAAASLPGIVMPARAAAAGGWLDHSSYTGRIGEAFYMRLENGKQFSMKLIAVNGDARVFDLVFQPTSSVLHAQATREMRHAALGTTHFFVVPFTAPRTTLKYLVSINRSH